MRAFFLYFLLVGPVCSATIDQNNDFQIWIKQISSLKIKEKTTIFLTEEVRFGDNASKAFYVYVEPRLEIFVSPTFSWGPGYRHIYRRRIFENKWDFEYTPLVDFRLLRKSGNWEITNRVRFMYFFRPAIQDSLELRNQFTIWTPFEWANMKLYVYDEVFFDSRRAFFENRFSAGGRLRFCEKVSAQLGYIFRDLKGFRHAWTHQHIITVVFSLIF